MREFVAATFGAPLVEIVTVVFGSTGAIGAIVALMKIRPDADTAAVQRASTGAEILARAAERLERDRDEWQERAVQAEERIGELGADIVRLSRELADCQGAHGRRSRD